MRATESDAAQCGWGSDQRVDALPHGYEFITCMPRSLNARDGPWKSSATYMSTPVDAEAPFKGLISTTCTVYIVSSQYSIGSYSRHVIPA